MSSGQQMEHALNFHRAGKKTFRVSAYDGKVKGKVN
jgi:hypothetical protein